MNETVCGLGNPEFSVTALVARWRAPFSTLTWINCGHPAAYLVDAEGNLDELAPPTQPALGAIDADASWRPAHRRLRSGERVILLTDGVIERRLEAGGRFGVDGLRHALGRADKPTAASTATAITQAVTDCWREPLEDDATVAVMAIA